MGGLSGACPRERRRRTQAERVSDRQERRKRDGTQPRKPHVVDRALARSARQPHGPVNPSLGGPQSPPRWRAPGRRPNRAAPPVQPRLGWHWAFDRCRPVRQRSPVRVCSL